MRITSFLVLILSLVIFTNSIDAQLKDLFKKVIGGEKKDTEQTESDSRIVEGLKEALNVGTNNAVASVSQLDGYLKNDLIKIPLPPEISKVESLLKTVGAGKLADDFVMSMNRAAESAAKEAAPIFIDAIKQMTIQDAIKILNGRDNEATLYFQEKTTAPLTEKFSPIVSKTMDENNVTKYYKELSGKVNSIPFASKINVDLDKYVTEKALEGLFTVVGQEEAKIRTDPAARVTDLLKDIFGKNP